jgi:hypothetical protein
MPILEWLTAKITKETVKATGELAKTGVEIRKDLVETEKARLEVEELKKKREEANRPRFYEATHEDLLKYDPNTQKLMMSIQASEYEARRRIDIPLSASPPARFRVVMWLYLFLAFAGLVWGIHTLWHHGGPKALVVVIVPVVSLIAAAVVANVSILRRR